MKKLLLGLGSIASVVVPMAAVISCGDDDNNNNNNTQAHTVALTGTVFGEITTGLNATLAIPVADVKDAVAGDNFTKNSFHVEHYVKITFKRDSSYDAGTGAQQVKAGETLIIGSTDSRRRVDAAANLKVAYINENDVLQDLTETLASNNKLAALKTGVMDKVVAYLQGQHSSGGDHSGQTQQGLNVERVMIYPSSPTRLIIAVVNMAPNAVVPTHIAKSDIEPAMAQVSALEGLNAVTEVLFAYTSADTTDPSNIVTDTQYFNITIAAGKANDVDAIAAAAATVTGVAPGATPPSTGTGGSGSTGGTTNPELGAERAKLDGTFHSTLTKAQIATALQGMNGGDEIVDPATTLGITIPALATGVTATFALQQPFHSSASSAYLTATVQASWDTDMSATMIITPAPSLTQDDFDRWTAPVGFTAQTSTFSTATIKTNIAASHVSLSYLGIEKFVTPPNGTVLADYGFSAAINTAMGTNGWSGDGTLNVTVTVTHTPTGVHKDIPVVVTPTEPVDLNNLAGADFNAIADVTVPVWSSELWNQIRAENSDTTIHWNYLTAGILQRIFSHTDMDRVTTSPTFVSTVNSNGKKYNIKYEMTEPTSGTVQGPFTITAVATAADGSGVVNNKKTFTVTTTTKVYTVGFAKIDSTTPTQINVGSATDIVTTDQPAPTKASQLDAVYAKGIVDGIKELAKTKATEVAAATSIVVTLVGSDAGTPKTITITVAAGDATDETKVLAALATATIV